MDHLHLGGILALAGAEVTVLDAVATGGHVAGPTGPAARRGPWPIELGGARRLADEVLFPDATRVDGLGAIPEAHFAAIAAAGLFGASAPVTAGGLGLDLSAMCSVAE